MKNKNPLLLLSALALMSCGAATSSGSDPIVISGSLPEQSDFVDVDVRSLPAKQRTYYQLLVYSFADGDGDGFGDFKGIIDNLDYLQGLGIGGIWLSPILKANSYHAYDVVDYYAVNPKYEVTVNGTKYDLERLLNACHDKGIKVLMDMVFNHSSSSCAWVSSHPDWYKGPDAFGGSMKDFNYDNQELRAEIKKVGKYWLDKGVDGFRLDAAKWIYNYGGVFDGADDEKNYAWWNEFYTACQTVNPDVYMVGEVLVENYLPDDRNYYKTGMDSNFNFELRAEVKKVLQGNPSAYVNHLVGFQNEIRGNNAKAIEADCLSNHDIGRFNQINNLSAPKQSLAGMLNILGPGDSYVYYGEELGLTGSCPQGYADMAYRTPMPFAQGRTDSTKYFESFKGDGRSTSVTLSGKSAKEDLADAASLANDFGDAIKAKNRAKTLYAGKIEANNTSFDGDLASFATTLGNDANTVLFNCGAKGKYISLAANATLIGESAYGDAHNGFVDGYLYMAPYSCAVFEGKVSFTGSANADGGQTSSASSQSVPSLTPDNPGSPVTEEKSGRLVLHCAPIDGWGSLNCYAWVGNQTYLGGWPGSAIDLVDGWYNVTIPHGASNVIFNDGSNQTSDLYRPNAGEYWFVASSSDNKTGGNWYTQNPNV